MSISTATRPGPSGDVARAWLARWDRQQERYMADREERFTVVGDVLAAVVERPDPLIVDLGAGPGSMSVRLLDRFPEATVVAVDTDPLLLGLARGAYADRAGLRIVEADLRDDDWTTALGLERPADAVVSSTALHWLTGPQLQDLYAQVGRITVAGGVFVDADHLHDAPHRPRLDAVTRAVRDARTARVGTDPAGEDWEQWWSAVGADADLAVLVGERGARPIEHTVPDVPGLIDHITFLRVAGFTEIGTVWQSGDDRVLVALR